MNTNPTTTSTSERGKSAYVNNAKIENKLEIKSGENSEKFQ